MMKKIVILLAVIPLILSACCQKADESTRPLYELIERILPENKNSFVVELQESDHDFFELEQLDKKIKVTGNNGVSIARGINHYLRNYCHKSISWCGNNIDQLPSPLPAINEKIRIEASFPYRYYLNYCTYSYSMAFWKWEQWEKEIDRMALQGINMPLMAVYSQYKVWQNTLQKLGYSEREISDFLPGAGYEAWWLMGNLEGFGGPVTQTFIDNQSDLEKKMICRMSELGMKPVFQGFFGMVPNSLKAKYPDARIKEQGLWLGYQRPAFLDPTDPLFDKIAAIYYDEQKKLFGEAQFFGGDPFHEGGKSDGIDVKLAAQKIVQAMKKSTPNAIWILQGWQDNPKAAILEGVAPGDALILDLVSYVRPQDNETKNSLLHKEKKYKNHPWIWCGIPNFGGKIGLHGMMNNCATGAFKAKNNPLENNITGIGTAPEGIGTNPVVYDMIYDLAWQTDSIEIEKWLTNYTHYRYGVVNEDCNKAWRILSQTIYECHEENGGPFESYFCARPADIINHTSTWGSTALFYDPAAIVQAWELILRAQDKLKESDTYGYDLTDITRQVLSDYGKRIHKEMVTAFQKKDKAAFALYSDKFLRLIKDMDKLLSTRKEFLLGTWLAEAKEKGSTASEKECFVTNAKRQITTWADKESDLHDYANKEWSGLLTDFYLPRWEAYTAYKIDLLNGKKPIMPHYAEMELQWVLKEKNYPIEISKESSIDIARLLYQQYHAEIKEAYKITEF